MPYKDPAKQAEATRRWRERNPERASASARARAKRRRETRADDVRAYERAYAARDDVRERRRARDRARYQSDPAAAAAKRAAIRNRNPSANREYQRKRYAASESVRAVYLKNARIRRDRVRASGGASSPEQIAGRLEFYGHRCAYCSGPYEQMDHVIPLVQGGTGWPANLRPACRPCNLSKKDLTPEQWMASGRPRAAMLQKRKKAA